MGAAKSRGMYLSPEEAHELEAIAASHPSILPKQNGTFLVNPSQLESEDGKKASDDKEWYSRQEVESMALILHGVVRRVLGVKRVKHKRTYETLTRAPRIIQPSRLLNL